MEIKDMLCCMCKNGIKVVCNLIGRGLSGVCMCVTPEVFTCNYRGQPWLTGIYIYLRLWRAAGEVWRCYVSKLGVCKWGVLTFLYSLCGRERIHRILTGIANSEQPKKKKNPNARFFTYSAYLPLISMFQWRKSMVN